MNAKTFEDFAIAARAAGFDEVLERGWAPNTKLDVHTHHFDAEAVVTQGEMWLTCDGVTQHLTNSHTFTIAREVPTRSATVHKAQLIGWRVALLKRTHRRAIVKAAYWTNRLQTSLKRPV